MDEGLRRKQEGQQLALDAAVPWKDQAREAIEWFAAQGEYFTSEDVTLKVGLPKGKVGTNQNNAVGAAMTSAAKAGIIRRVGYTQSRRASSHGAVIAVWVGEDQPCAATGIEVCDCIPGGHPGNCDALLKGWPRARADTLHSNESGNADESPSPATGERWTPAEVYIARTAAAEQEQP